ncbi:WD40 repeat-like protein, partial [Coniophora puteana RWD-64-598 SS2]
GTEMTLDDMSYAGGAACVDDRKLCLPGTRTQVLEEIDQWINCTEADCPKVLLLTGVAGSGKSAIAHSVAKKYHDLGRTGASFACKRGDSSRDAQKMFSTMARNLADWNQTFKSELSEKITNDKELRTTTIPKRQFESFIVEPLNQVEKSQCGPLLLVVDAVDEAGGDKNSVLEALAGKADELPLHVRLLVTARPESEIMDQLGKDHIQKIQLHHSPEDVQTFVHQKLKGVDQLKDDQKKQIILKSEGLFQWASTVCNALSKPPAGKTSSIVYEQIMKSSHKNRDLTALYESIMDIIFPDPDEDSMSNCRSVLAFVFGTKIPLPLAAIQTLHDCNGNKGIAEATLKHMGSLLAGVTEGDSDAVRPLHTSFRDWILDPSNKSRFGINMPDHMLYLCQSLIKVMDQELRFNMACIPTSYQRNEDIKELKNDIEANITIQLKYASCHWMEHVSDVGDRDLQTLIRHWLLEKLFFWIEVLALMQKLPTASSCMNMLRHWAHDEDIKSLAADALAFLTEYKDPFLESTAHLYISALVFFPEASFIRKKLINAKFTCADTSSGLVTNWPSSQGCVLKPLEGHSGPTSSVAFSPDGKHVVSGSDDRTIRVWDVATGVCVLEPLEGHSELVNSVAFSPDGKHIVSGSDDETIRVWNAATGVCVLGPLEGHNSLVKSVAFSPDGKHIVSGSNDQTIRIWSATIGEYVLGPLEGHSGWVHSVAFSPDGKHIVSGSHDKTIKVWDAAIGESMLKSLEGHSGPVRSVAFSPDGKHVVSGSWDKTIRVWDAATGECVLEPLEGHNSSVKSVAFSPDGKHIVSGSDDKTIRLVNSVAFSPDGKHIVSGSDDRTIRVWSTATGECALGPLKGHSGGVHSVAFSPDGKHIVSGSYDETIRAPNHTNSLGIPSSWAWEAYYGEITGWLKDPDGNLMLWVPKWARAGLYWDRNTLVICSGAKVKLDMTNFVHGTDWTKCYM